MMKTYREVKCSERLPDEYGTYIVKFKGGDKEFADVTKTTKTNDSYSGRKWETQIEWWLEEIETQPASEQGKTEPTDFREKVTIQDFKKKVQELDRESGYELNDVQIRWAFSAAKELFPLLPDVTEEMIEKIIGIQARRFCTGFNSNIISHNSAKAVLELFRKEGR